jgi:hypothetical protein
MPRLWWALTQDELPAQDGGLSKGIKYSYTLFGVGEAAGDALRGQCSYFITPTQGENKLGDRKCEHIDYYCKTPEIVIITWKNP